MLRDAVGKQLDHDPNFRWRGEAVTRIENLSDIAFALALGMLISGVDAPTDYLSLKKFLWSIIPAALGFSVLLGLWHGHYTFFRRYGVADRRILFLNAVLIFVVLFMAYPLRFAFDSLFAFLTTLVTGDFSRSQELGVTSMAVAGEFVAYFSLAYALSFAIFAMMYGHVLKRADLLALTASELAVTRQMHTARWVQFVIAMMTAGLAFFTPLGPIAGSLLGFFFFAYWWAERRHPIPAIGSV
ncbi:hypothetical protein GCM10009069_20150 [Algimonas arctica]|uniref:DUF1211 domain-containing protein n=1 Tax=Algimonas arctica TaxID=1479486 RepID=A0A8J3CR40_9PROT|nr:TMEM175 family protein [Algimonas arctica]GHA97082.1 hypothetical protein GCM10009069_20150 [Algimonas arctica]